MNWIASFGGHLGDAVLFARLRRSAADSFWHHPLMHLQIVRNSGLAIAELARGPDQHNTYSVPCRLTALLRRQVS